MIKQENSQEQIESRRKRPKSKDKIVPNFLIKTYQILEKPEYNHIISWNSQGNGFIVKNKTDLIEKVLPKYFKHNNYCSFVRQLNMYDFHKSKSSNSNHQGFTNPNFLRSNKNALTKFKRKRGSVQQSDKHSDLQVDIVANTSDSLLIKQVINLKKKQDEIERVVDVLAEQNKQILQQNQRLWKRMKKTMEREEKKFQNILFLFFLKNGGHVPEEMITNQPISDGNHEMNQALLPVQQPKQNIIDTIMGRFQNQQRSNFKDLLFSQNNQQNMKLFNSVINQINHNRDDNKNLLQLQNDVDYLNASPALSPIPTPSSPITFPLQDSRLSSPMYSSLPESNNLHDLPNLSLQKGISGVFPLQQPSLVDIRDIDNIESDFENQK